VNKSSLKLQTFSGPNANKIKARKCDLRLPVRRPQGGPKEAPCICESVHPTDPTLEAALPVRAGSRLVNTTSVHTAGINLCIPICKSKEFSFTILFLTW
jgi:hypothetical protein